VKARRKSRRARRRQRRWISEKWHQHPMHYPPPVRSMTGSLEGGLSGSPKTLPTTADGGRRPCRCPRAGRPRTGRTAWAPARPTQRTCNAQDRLALGVLPGKGGKRRERPGEGIEKTGETGTARGRARAGRRWLARKFGWLDRGRRTGRRATSVGVGEMAESLVRQGDCTRKRRSGRPRELLLRARVEKKCLRRRNSAENQRDGTSRRAGLGARTLAWRNPGSRPLEQPFGRRRRTGRRHRPGHRMHKVREPVGGASRRPRARRGAPCVSPRRRSSGGPS